MKVHLPICGLPLRAALVFSFHIPCKNAAAGCRPFHFPLSNQKFE
jgi:hypothetical protein